VLHGADQITRWQERADLYPDALARKLVESHLSQLSNDFAMHIERSDWLFYNQAVTEAAYHLMAALLALNHVYRPELKRMHDLCDELPIKPDNLLERLNALLRGDPMDAGRTLDALAEDAFALAEARLSGLNTAPIRASFALRRSPHDQPPI
jgi:hypothetical protein